MTFLHRLDPLLPLDRQAGAPDPRPLDRSSMREYAAPVDLTRLAHQAVERAVAASQPWRPKHGHAWLT